MRLIPLVFAVMACGGVTAEAPLMVKLGQTHAETENALRAQQFCLETSTSEVKHTQQKQVYPRCKRAASELGDAWVIARYDGDKLIELRRYERYGDDSHAVARWNELVEAHMKRGPASERALQQIKDRGQLEAGTRAVKAFTSPDGSVVGVYLLTPSPPENASVLERVAFMQ